MRGWCGFKHVLDVVRVPADVDIDIVHERWRSGDGVGVWVFVKRYCQQGEVTMTLAVFPLHNET